MSLPASLILLDVETTGANPLTDRVTEIALLHVQHGEVVERWESLVNPLCPIPPLIQRFTGITDEMVAAAPTFAELAAALRVRLGKGVFVAHNARFDYGFVRNEFARLGQEFEASVLCTVKLSRALFPEHHRHGLDALIARHGFVCGARHRAMGDTEVLLQFTRLVSGAFPPEALAKACERAMKLPARAPGLPEGVLEGLPDAPGVYSFFGDKERSLYVGRSANLRGRVMEHFAPGKRKGKEAQLAEQVRRVEWIETAGELEALLLEARLVKERRPLHNRVADDEGRVFGLRLLANRKRPPIFERVPLAGTDPAAWGDIHGAFRHRKEADNLLRELAQLYDLCLRRLGLEPGTSGPCSAHQAKRCAGACVGRESADSHDARLAGALGALKAKAWPWPGAVVVAERAEHSGREAFHLFDHWCHLGSTEDAGAVPSLAGGVAARRFDPDIYRILVRWLAVPANRERVTPLAEGDGTWRAERRAEPMA